MPDEMFAHETMFNQTHEVEFQEILDRWTALQPRMIVPDQPQLWVVKND